MPVVVRPATVADADDWASVVAAASPYLVQDGRSVAHEMRTDPPGAVRRVAESDGRVVGVARLHDYADEDHASLLVMVAPDTRRGGVGGTLLNALSSDIAATGKASLHSIVEDDDASRAAALAWGFDLTRTFRMSSVDPRAVTPGSRDPRLVTLDHVEPRALHALFNEVVGDDPSGLSLQCTWEQCTWEEWLDEWQDPRNRPELSSGVVIDDELVAFSQLGAAETRAWSSMTGTHPDHRGRGLATLAKRHTLTLAAASGITRCFAGNDGANAPMVALNTRLGYRPFAAPRLGISQIRDR